MGKEYLRLDSKFTSVAAFWTPDCRDEVTTGTLTISEDGIRFVTSPKYSLGDKVLPFNPTQWNSDQTLRSEVMHGFFEGEDCTLLNVLEVDQPGLASYKDEVQAVVSTAQRASLFVSGMRTGAMNDKCLDRARYTFSSLSQFVNTPSSEKWDGGLITIEIQSEPQVLLDFPCLNLTSTSN